MSLFCNNTFAVITVITTHYVFVSVCCVFIIVFAGRLTETRFPQFLILDKAAAIGVIRKNFASWEMMVLLIWMRLHMKILNSSLRHFRRYRRQFNRTLKPAEETKMSRRLSTRVFTVSLADLSETGRKFVNAAINFAKSDEFEEADFAIKFMEHWMHVLTIEDPRGLRYDPEIFQLSSSLLHHLGVNKYNELRFSELFLPIYFCAHAEKADETWFSSSLFSLARYFILPTSCFRAQ